MLFLQDVEGMMSISVEAAEARDSLSDDKELISTYEVELCCCILFSRGLNPSAILYHYVSYLIFICWFGLRDLPLLMESGGLH